MNGHAPDRRPMLSKASAGDLVAELTNSKNLGASALPTDVPTKMTPATESVRRGRGRPRGRRRMEPFSSKIEIGLRDAVDSYLAEHDETIVDLIDRALRAAIGGA